ncbi:hypothetical protein ACFFRR_005583 [Megaselia abdita]
MKLLSLCFISLINVSSVILVQNDGPYLNTNSNNILQQAYLSPETYVNQDYIPALPSNSNNNKNNIVSHENNMNQQNVYLNLPPQEQQLSQYPTYYPFPQPKRKHYKIVLIRPPSPPPQQQIPQEIEEQTIVYVLVKKPDEPKIDLQQSEPVFKPSKPEVYFIKYQTKEERDKAQPQLSTNAPSNQSQKHTSQYLPPISRTS